MGESDRSTALAGTTPLAGLVSQEAEVLYWRLRAAGSVHAEKFHDSGQAAVELLDTGVAVPSSVDAELITPVDPATALRLLLSHRQRELVDRQDRIIEGWRRLTAMLPACNAQPAPDDVSHTNTNTTTAGNDSEHRPGEIQLRVLRMMPTEDDAAIARRLRLSVSTVRRHIKSLYLMLGVNNRFAAGMAAAKRGWV